MRRSAMTACFAFLALTPGVCPARGPEPPSLSQLPNGLTVIFQPRPEAETFGLALLARGGSAQDPDEDFGLTALLSRMLLRGSRGMSGPDLARLVESLGATLDPVEGRISVGLRSTGPASAFPRLLEAIAGTIARPRLDPDDLAKEKEVLRQGLETSLDQPSTHLWRRALPILFAGHPLGRIADPKIYLTAIDIDRVRGAHVRRFTGRRTVLAITGSLEGAEVLALVTRHLGGLPAGDVTAIALPQPRPAGPIPRARARHRTSQAELLVAAPTQGIHPDEAEAMDLLAQMLGGANERLYFELREKRGWAYLVAPVDWRFPGAGLFGIRTAVARKHLAASEKIILSEIGRIAAEPPSRQEVDRAARLLVTARARSWQKSEARAMTHATAGIRGDPLIDVDEYARRLGRVTPGQISQLARRLAAYSQFSVVVLR